MKHAAAQLALVVLSLSAAACCATGEVRGDPGPGPIRVIVYSGFGARTDFVKRAVALANEQLTSESVALRLTQFTEYDLDHAADRGALRDDDGAQVLATMRIPREVSIACFMPLFPWDSTDADSAVGGRSIRINGRMLASDEGGDEVMLPYWAGTIAHEFSHSAGYEHASQTARRSVPFVIGRIICEGAGGGAGHAGPCPGRPVAPSGW